MKNRAQVLGEQLCADAGPDLIPIAVIFLSPTKKTFSITYHTAMKGLLQGQGGAIAKTINEAVGPPPIPTKFKHRKPV